MKRRLSRNRLAFIASLNLSMSESLRMEDIWIKYETEIYECIRKHGKRHTLGRYKESYLFLRNVLLQLPTQPIEFMKVDKNGLPKTLWTLRPLIKGDRQTKRAALTIARSFEQIRLEIDYSTESITIENSPEVERTVRNRTKLLRRFLRRFTRNRKWYLGSFHNPIQPWSKVLTLHGKGPNGPAVATSHLDAKAVTQDSALYQALKDLNNALGQSWITSWCEEQAAHSSVSKDTKLYTGRLGFSAEPAGKTRIFAIGDYWSQLSLKPVQLALYRTLQSISTDSTANQDLGFSSLVQESLGHPTYCFDLSSASDRIPAQAQKPRLELMSNLHVADSWYRLMTQRDFYIKSTGRYVRWSVGQPLGLLSSFPSFALWHHDVVQLAANWENFHRGKPLRFFKQYRLLGDDIVIFDAKVARRYQNLLKSFGLTINLTKSVIGDSENSQIEFTKRLALKGKEMSSIKHNILSKDSVIDLVDLIDLLFKRDFITPDSGHRGLHRILKSGDSLRLQFVLWLRCSDAPQFVFEEGNVSLSFNRDEVMKLIAKKRSANIIEKASKVKALDMERIYPDLVKGFTSLGVPYDGKVLADRSIGDLSGSHPIVLALTQTSRELQFLMFSVLDDLDPDEISPVEYLPIVSHKEYFYDLSAKRRYLSEIILECLNELQMKVGRNDVDNDTAEAAPGK